MTMTSDTKNCCTLDRSHLALFFVAATLFLLVAFQGYQVLDARVSLQANLDAQRPALEETDTIRTRLQSLAAATVKLASEGNKQAAEIVAELKQAGLITDTPPQTAAPTAAPAAAPTATAPTATK
jgi:hypothetical protein